MSDMSSVPKPADVEPSLVEESLNKQAQEARSWISEALNAAFPVDKKSVANRFMRDCTLLIQDIDGEDSLSSSDLDDFFDRHASLEVQFENLAPHIRRAQPGA